MFPQRQHSFTRAGAQHTPSQRASFSLAYLTAFQTSNSRQVSDSRVLSAFGRHLFLMRCCLSLSDISRHRQPRLAVCNSLFRRMRLFGDAINGDNAAKEDLMRLIASYAF